jgi:citrate synthase
MSGESESPIRSDIAWSAPDRIVIRGRNLADEILGHMDIGQFAYFQLTGREASPQESVIFNAILVSLAEHGITPSVLAARLTYAGAPESLQAAVAAGLCGVGSRLVGSLEGATEMLYEALPDSSAEPDLRATADRTVAAFRAAGRAIPGIGHFLHKPVDPRTTRLFELAEQNGMYGRYVTLMAHIAEEAERTTGRVLPVNATGAAGALCCELGFPASIVRGFGVMARAIGLVGHLLEEQSDPIAMTVWHDVERAATEHKRPS